MSTLKKWALITGATSGIGLEFAKILAPDYHLILVGKNDLKLKEAKETLENGLISQDVKIEIIYSDLNSPTSAEYIFKECQNRALAVEVLINNAGVRIFGEYVELKDSDIINMLDINITVLTFLCKYFGYEMKKRKSGYILNVASLGAYQPVPWIANYAAFKNYLLNFSEALSKELED